jgi:hypothetical protein
MRNTSGRIGSSLELEVTVTAIKSVTGRSNLNYCTLSKRLRTEYEIRPVLVHLKNSVKHILLPVLITLAAFLSFKYNFFRVASDNLFLEHDLYSEQIVLDGIVHGFDEYGRLTLGRYSRPEIQNQDLEAHQLYSEGNSEGHFIQYKSQFGLQLYLFKFLSKFSAGDVGFLQDVTALAMSATVGLLFLAIRREFALLPALWFSGTLILSPWVVIFARNLYWCEATWFLPMLVSMFLGKAAFATTAGMLKMMTALFFVFLLKFLCGYEYLTTIYLASCVPIAYYAIRYDYGIRQGIQKAILSGMVCSLAFVGAVGIHTHSLSLDGHSGWADIVLAAKKRLSSDSPEEIAKEACKSDTDIEACENLVVKSLSSNRFSVTAKYFLVPHFFPWIDRFQSKVVIAMQDLQKVGFVGLIICVVLCWAKLPTAVKPAIALGFLAPVSWFFIFKGHSYVHYHLNYVLWYLPFIPFCFMALGSVVCFRKSGDRTV